MFYYPDSNSFSAIAEPKSAELDSE